MNNSQIFTPKLSNELNAIFENANVGLMLMDKKGRVVNINPTGLKLVNKDRQFVIGKSNGEVFSCINALKDGKSVCGYTENCKDCTVRHKINNAISKNIRQEKEDGKLTIFEADGKRKIIHLLVSTSNISINDEEYILLTIDEISKIKQQEEELQRLNEDKNKFLSILSHDLRSPYNSFIGFTDILLKSWKTMPAEKVDRILNSLHSVAKSSYELLDDLLSWAKSQSEKTQFNPQILNCTEVYKSIYQSIEHALELKNIRLNLLSDENCSIYADEKMLSTILRNLLTNAIKFSKKGQDIVVEIKMTHNATIVSVIDQGVGISKEVQAQLFDISRMSSSPGTEGEKGSGLGLLLCKEFVVKHKGTISVNSELGHGSVFSFSLPNN